MSDKTLIITVGLPRSGRSTWARKQNLPMVNTDSIRMALYGQPFILDAEEMVWTIAKYMVKALFIAGHKTVILDATNTRKVLRDKWQSKDWECQFKIFNTDKETCLERAIKNNQPELIPIIETMSMYWEDVVDILEGEVI